MTVDQKTDTSTPGPDVGRKSGAVPIIARVLGFVIAVMGVIVIVVGATLAVAFPEQGQDGYLTSSVGEVSTSSYALTSPPVAINTDNVPFDLGGLRFTGESTAPDSQIFVGVGHKSDVDSYLSGIHTTEITSVQIVPHRVQYRDVPGSAIPTPPIEQSFWTTSSSGSGAQQITTDIRTGDWVLVVMNSDASAGITANMQAAVNAPLVGSIISGLWIGGITAMILGTGLIVGGTIFLRRQVPRSNTGVLTAAGAAGQIPVRLSGRPIERSPESQEIARFSDREGPST